MSYLADLIKRQQEKNKKKQPQAPQPIISIQQPVNNQRVSVVPSQDNRRVVIGPAQDNRTIVVPRQSAPVYGPPSPQPKVEIKPLPDTRPVIVPTRPSPITLPGSPLYQPSRIDQKLIQTPSYGAELLRKATGQDLLPGVYDASGKIAGPYAPPKKSLWETAKSLVSDYTDARQALGESVMRGASKVPGALKTAGIAIVDYVDAEGTRRSTAIERGQQKTSDFLVHDVAQATARNVSSVFATIYAEPGETEIPTNQSQQGRILYGGEPIKVLSKRITDNESAQTAFVGKTGAKITAPLTVFGSILFDVLTGGQGKTAEKVIAKLADVEKILPILKNLGYEDDIAEALAAKLVSKNTAAEVRTTLQAGAKVQDARRAAAAEAGSISLAVDKGGTKVYMELSAEEQKYFANELGKFPGESGLYLDATAKEGAEKVSREEFLQMAPEARKAFDEFATGARKADNIVEAPVAQVPVEDLITRAETRNPIVDRVLEFFSPIKRTSEKVQTAYRNLVSSSLEAKAVANVVAKSLKFIPEKEGLQILVDYTKGKATKYTDDIKKVFDKLYDLAKAKGLDVPYRTNYLPQVWVNTAEEVKIAAAKFMREMGVSDNIIKSYLDESAQLPENLAKKLNMNASFTQQRLFPDYETGIKYGLKPKYTNPAQLAGYYREELDTVVANRKFIEDLKKTGDLVTSENKIAGYRVVENLPGAGRNTYYAKPEVASVLNGIFRNENALTWPERLVRFTAKVSKKAQEIALSAGVPYTNINFFSMGQAIKEVTAGNFKAITAFLRANSMARSVKFFEENQPFLKMMAEDGLDLSNHVGSWEKMYKTLSADKSF
jgi:hypothetical protein